MDELLLDSGGVVLQGMCTSVARTLGTERGQFYNTAPNFSLLETNVQIKKNNVKAFKAASSFGL